MPDRLLLRLAPDGGLTWLRQASAASVQVASEPGIPPAGALQGAAEIVVLVPGEDVLVTSTRLAARNRAQLMQALPYAVEDQLLAPVEDLHFVASRGDGDEVGVAVVAKERMRAWLDQLAANGIRPDVLMPETLALPVDAEQTSVLVEDARVLARTDAWSAFACAPGELAGWLAQTSDSLTPLAVHDVRAAAPLALPAKIASYRERQRDPLAFLAGSLRTGSSTTLALNLLDGEFAMRHRGARGQRWWRVTAALAAAILLLAFANLGADLWRLSRESARMDALAQDAIHKAFPDIDAAQLARLSPEQLMRGRLDRLRGGAESSGLLHALAVVAPVLGTSSPTQMQTRGLEYRNGTLELALHAQSVAMLDSVRERLATMPGLKAEVTAANPVADGVDGRIRVVATDARGGTP